MPLSRVLTALLVALAAPQCSVGVAIAPPSGTRSTRAEQNRALDEIFLEGRDTVVRGTTTSALTKTIKTGNGTGYTMSLPQGSCGETIVPGNFITPDNGTITNATLGQIQRAILAMPAASVNDYLSTYAAKVQSDLDNVWTQAFCGNTSVIPRSVVAGGGVDDDHHNVATDDGGGKVPRALMARQEGNWRWGGGFYVAYLLSVVPGALVAKFVVYDFTLPAANRTITYGSESDVLTSVAVAALSNVLVVQHVRKATMGKIEVYLTSVLLTVISNMGNVALAAFAAALNLCANFDFLTQALTDEIANSNGNLAVVPPTAAGVLQGPVGGGTYVEGPPLAAGCLG